MTAYIVIDDKIDSSEHQTLRQLVHLAEDGGPWTGFGSSPLCESGPIPFNTASIWWTDSGKTKKIVQKSITRNANTTPATIQWQAFDVDGITVVESFTDTITYDGVYEVSRLRTSP